MSFSRVIESEDVIIEFMIDGDCVSLTHLNLEDQSHEEAAFKLSDFNKEFHVNFTFQGLKSAIDNLDKRTFLKLHSVLLHHYNSKTTSSKYWKIIHSLYASTLQVETNPRMEIGYELGKESDVIIIHIYCIEHELYAFNESFLEEFFDADCKVKYDFLLLLPQSDVFGKIVDFYQKGINHNSDFIQKELIIYSRDRKLSRLLN